MSPDSSAGVNSVPAKHAEAFILPLGENVLFYVLRLSPPLLFQGTSTSGGAANALSHNPTPQSTGVSQ